MSARTPSSTSSRRHSKSAGTAVQGRQNDPQGNGISRPSGRATPPQRGHAAGGPGGAENASEGAPLVHIRDRLPPPCAPNDLREIVDQETGEILVVRRGHDCSFQIVLTPAKRRARRHVRKAMARKHTSPKHRLHACCRVPLAHAHEIEVWKRLGVPYGAHFKGLMTCGNVWLCAVCEAKISERRQAELQTAIALAEAEGLQVWLATYTFSHGRFDVLKDSLHKLAEARKRLKAGQPYERIRRDFGIVGTVQAFEITHGPRHGWHPHIHELIFVRGDADLAEFKERMFERWRLGCLRAGLGEPSRRHGFDVRDGKAAAGYVAKGIGSENWGLAHEMTKANAKVGRGGNRSPAQLLDCCADPDSSPEHVKEAERLWVEYAEATKGRRQLVWSKGLKDRFAIADKSDEEVAAEAEEDSYLLAIIPLDAWRVIVKFDLQATVLNIADEAGPGAEAAIFALVEAYRPFMAGVNPSHCAVEVCSFLE